MTLDELLVLVKRGETELFECKRTTDERRKGASSLCAMLDHRGGRLVFGIAPDGQVIGQQVSDHTVEELAQKSERIGMLKTNLDLQCRDAGIKLTCL